MPIDRRQTPISSSADNQKTTFFSPFQSSIVSQKKGPQIEDLVLVLGVDGNIVVTTARLGSLSGLVLWATGALEVLGLGLPNPKAAIVRTTAPWHFFEGSVEVDAQKHEGKEEKRGASPSSLRVDAAALLVGDLAVVALAGGGAAVCYGRAGEPGLVGFVDAGFGG